MTNPKNESKTTMGQRLVKGGAIVAALYTVFSIGQKVYHVISPPPPQELLVSVTRIMTESPRTEHVYFASHHQEEIKEREAFFDEGGDQREFNTHTQALGATVEFHIETRGPAGHKWYATEVVYNALSGERVVHPNGNLLHNTPVVRIANREGGGEPSWIEYPTCTQRYFVQIEVTGGSRPETAVSRPFGMPVADRKTKCRHNRQTVNEAGRS